MQRVWDNRWKRALWRVSNDASDGCTRPETRGVGAADQLGPWGYKVRFFGANFPISV